MAKKRLDVITELYAEAVGDVTEKPENWMAFLKSASRNYRLPFDEQVLIHAQRPDAEAVLTMDGWNKKFGRWVKRDSKGIAVIDKSGSRMKLKYYFDISDTQESRYKRLVRPVPLWEVKEEHREEVKETLANAFDVTAGKEFTEVIKEAAAHAAEDNLTDYMGDMMDASEGSALEGLDGENVAVRAKALLSASIGYMVMARCGLDTETFFDKEDFEGIAEFHAQRLAGIFGTVTSVVAEMALSQISDTV
ncbi:MAG: helicase, partial [Lachnospiraceae bacterium]|nr:helicase [Lachnospiraceae bacterium]